MRIKTKLMVVNVTNWIMLVTFVLIMLWMYVFIVNMTFKLNVFSEGTSTLFYTSILAAISMILGAAIINVSTNINIIADSKAVVDQTETPKNRKKVLLWALAVTIAIPVILFVSDNFSRMMHERKIVKEVENVISRYHKTVAFVAENAGKKEKVKEVAEGVVFLANQNKELAAARLIMIKDFQGQNAYIYLDEWSNPNKGVSNYLKCKEEIRKYLDSVFTKKNRAKYYDKENSALYFPVISGDNIAVLCFEKRMEYGRLGS